MTIEQFENIINTQTHKEILHVFFGRGKHLKWAVCRQRSYEKTDELIVYDHRGYAWLFCELKDGSDSYFIIFSEGKVWVNGRETLRTPREDLPTAIDQRLIDILRYEAEKDEIEVFHSMAHVVANVLFEMHNFPSLNQRVDNFQNLVWQYIGRAKKNANK